MVHEQTGRIRAPSERFHDRLVQIRAAKRSRRASSGASIIVTKIDFQAPKEASGASISKSRQGVEDCDDLQVVDLTQEIALVPNPNLGHRYYHKSHNLHTKAQTHTVRLPKQKPQFSYASGDQPSLPFLHRPDAWANELILDSRSDDFHYLTGITQNHSSALETLPADTGLTADADPFSSIQDDSLERMEAAMVGLDGSVMLGRPLTPKVDSSFVSQVFDFDAYHGKTEEQDVYSSPLMREVNKRAHSATPEVTSVKHRRVQEEEVMMGTLPINRPILNRAGYLEQARSFNSPGNSDEVVGSFVGQRNGSRPHSRA